MICTAAELRQITDKLGRPRRVSTQMRVLDALGIHYERRPDGSLAVLREHAYAVLEGRDKPRPAKTAEPNYEALA